MPNYNSIHSGADVDAAVTATQGLATVATSGDYDDLTDKPATLPPDAHASSHQSGGGDAIKLDDLAAPDDNTDLNATTSAHGLLPKLSGTATEFLNGAGAFSTPAGGSPAGSGTELQFRNGGAFGAVAGTSWASNQLLMTAQAAATTPLAVRAAASHTANLQEWQNSSGTALAKISSGGYYNGSAYLGNVSGDAIGYFSTSNFGGGGSWQWLGNRYGKYVSIASDWNYGFSDNTSNAQATRDLQLHRIAAGILGVRGTSTSVGAAINLLELSADPSDPSEGQGVIWQSDGTGSGDDGDWMIKVTAGGVTKTAILFDFSAA